jgi:hypothetical protein
MRRTAWMSLAALLVALPVVGFSYYQQTRPGEDMTAAAQKFLGALTGEQKQITLLEYDTPKRVEWHFIPKDYRKGLQIKEMTQPQRDAAHKLLQSCLSDIGYQKATKIMSLEALLNELEQGRGRNIRDPERYYFTIFGEPTDDGRWGLSIEGHHLSLNFVVENGKVIASTPQFFAANPTIVNFENNSDIEVGTRVLAQEEELAFKLVNMLDEQQLAQALIDEKAPAEIRAAGEPQPPQEPAAGLRLAEMTDEQREVLKQLAMTYLESMPSAVAEERYAAAENSNTDEIRFAWAGARKPGIGHYYRVQGETFLIEFVNTQPDAAGNPASHIHCVWRDMRGDFALPIN